ncbi:MAG TPA: hypothetical protein VMI31_10200, partial [Fimbriimonadaceae bacterium]|nr:hypothetical protein [Fimbriimonadaceae bacterium]
EGYGFGPMAYDNWMRAIKAGSGASHGNWWNGTVWGECRKMLSRYFDEITARLPRGAGSELARKYAEIARLLVEVSDRQRPAGDQIERLCAAKTLEEEAVELLESCVSAFSAS